MEAKESTKEQIKKVWGWCNLVLKDEVGYHGWYKYVGSAGLEWVADELQLDLNNLFKYTPLTCDADLHINFHEVHWVNGRVFTECVIIRDFVEVGRGLVEGQLRDCAVQALLQALNKVMEGEQNG